MPARQRRAGGPCRIRRGSLFSNLLNPIAAARGVPFQERSHQDRRLDAAPTRLPDKKGMDAQPATMTCNRGTQFRSTCVAISRRRLPDPL